MASVSLGRVTVVPKGMWSESTAYTKLDIVSYGGSSYMALKSVPAGTSLENTSYWQLIAQGGHDSAEWGDITGSIANQSDLNTALTGKASSTHTHGNITNAGAITSDTAVASGDKIVVADSSNSSKLIRTGISFDGSTTTTALTPKGTWEAFSASGHTHDSRYYTETEVDTKLGGYLPLTGGTLSGDITIEKNTTGYISLKNSLMDNTAETQSAVRYLTLYFKDKNDSNIAWVQTSQQTNGTSRISIGSRHSVNSSNVDNSLQLNVAKDGTKSITVSDASIWQTALSVYSKTEVDTALSGKADSSHAHGNITSAGAISSDTAVANGDKIVVTDSSASSKLIRTGISFDGSTATKALTQKGTWESFAAANHTHEGMATTDHNHDSRYVLKAGDTMTGILTIEKNASLYMALKHKGMDATADTISSALYGSVYFKDKNDITMGSLQLAQNTAGKSTMTLSASRNVDGTLTSNYVALGVGKTGTKTVSFSDTDVWRTALSVYSKSEVDTALSGKSDTSHNHDSSYLSLANGGTVNNAIIIKQSAMDVTTTPTSDKQRSLLFCDKNDVTVGSVHEYHFKTTGNLGMRIQVVRDVNGTQVANTLGLLVAPDGTRTVTVTDSAIWRSAINAVNKSGDTMTGNLNFTVPGSDRTATSLSSEVARITTFYDGNDARIGRIQMAQSTSGTSQLLLSAYHTNGSGTEVTHTLGIRVLKDGTRDVYTNGADAWRTALSIYSKSEVDTALAGKSDTGHAHAAGDITSGTLSLARGGTGQTTATNAANALLMSLEDGSAGYVSPRTLKIIAEASGANKFVKRTIEDFYKSMTASDVPDLSATYSTTGHTHSYLPLAGGTLTGNVTMSKSTPYLYLKNTLMDNTVNSQAAERYSAVVLSDKNDNIMGYFRVIQTTGATTVAEMRARKSVNSANVDNYLKLNVKADGTLSVQVSDASVWRTALSVYSTSEVYNKTEMDATLLTYLSLTSGGTVANDIGLRHGTMEVNTTPSSSKQRYLVFRDKNDTSMGSVNMLQSTNGKHGIGLQSNRTVNGTAYYNTLRLYVDASGNPSVGITTGADSAWREALGAANETHSHGYITNGGCISMGSDTLAATSGDCIVLTDSSNSDKIFKSPLSFDGSTATKALTQKGTWENFAPGNMPTYYKSVTSTTDTAKTVLQLYQDARTLYGTGAWIYYMAIVAGSSTTLCGDLPSSSTRGYLTIKQMSHSTDLRAVMTFESQSANVVKHRRVYVSSQAVLISEWY